MLRLRQSAAPRRFVRAVGAMALGTGMLAGATAISVLSTSSPAAAAPIKTQTANCTFNGVGNQLQGSPTVLVPFMVNGGAAVTPGTTTIDISCTGLPHSTTMIIGVASPIAGFNSTSYIATNALNEFMGSASSTGPDGEPSDIDGNLTFAETINTDQQALDTDAVCPPTAAQVALGLSNCAIAVADLAGNEYGFAYVNYPSTTSFPVTPWPGTYAVPVSATDTGYASPPSLSVLNVTDTAAFTYGTALTTNAAASEGDELGGTGTGQASCGFDVTTCTALPVPALSSAIAEGTVLLVGSLTGTHEIVVTTAPAALGATVIWVNNLVNTYSPGTAVTPVTGGSSTTNVGDTVFLTGNGFWGDPDGTLTEPLTVEVEDTAGTVGVGATNTQSPEAIGVDIYTATTHGGGISRGSGGTLTGGTLGLFETVPSGGLSYGAGGPGTGSPAAFAGGALTWIAVEPNVAPFNDAVSETTTTTGGPVAYSYDTNTDPCTTPGTDSGTVSYIHTLGGTVCGTPGPIPTGGNGTNPAPVGAIGLGQITLSSPLSVTTTSLPGGTVGTAYSTTLAATGGTSPYTWSLTSGTLPSWASLNSTTGAITGTPNAVATTSGLVFTATDSTSPTHNTAASGSLSIVVSPGALSVSTTSLPNGTVGNAYSTTLAATGGTSPYTWSLTSGTLPSWATLFAGTGVISGTPGAGTAGTTSGLVFTATDSASPTHATAASGSLSITITPALSVSTSSLPGGTVGTAYSTTLAATGGTSPYTWSLTGGTLPSWASLNATTGAITGTPNAVATTSGLVFTATDSTSPTHETAASGSLSIVVSPAPLSVTTTSLPGGTVGTAYSTTLAATGGTSPYTWSLTGGTLPSWASLNATTGAITGTPNAVATTSGLVFTATDSTSPTHNTAASGSLSIVILNPGVSTPPTVPGAPTGLTATAGKAQVALSWMAPSSDGGSSISGYDVYEGTSAGAESSTAVNTSLVFPSTYTVTGLTNGTTYYFTVEAVNAVGNSAASNEASATPMASPTPPPPSNACASYTGNSAFLCSTYEDLLGRAPDSGGLAYWNALLSAGTSRSTVAYDIATSPEGRGDLVAGYYEAYLGRAPDAGGLSYWVAQLAGGATDQTVAAGFLGSSEFYTDSGGTQAGFVTALYADLLGRAPDSGGLSYWEAQLSSGATQSAVAAAILSSTEYRTDFVTALYADLLGRAPDSGGLSYWVAQLAGGQSDESIISSIVGSAEYYTDATA